MSEPVTPRPPSTPSGHSVPPASDDERADAALRRLVRLLARIAVAEEIGTADPGEQSAPDLPA